MTPEWIFRVQLYNERGELLLETVHATETSKWVEVEVTKERMARGEVAYCEVTDLRVGGQTERIYGSGERSR